MAAATAVAVVGLAVGVATTAVSFTNAAAQKAKQQAAEREAEKAMNEARGRLDVNFAESMTIKKEAYDNEREALLVQGAMATNAGVESERGSAATAGRVFAAQQSGQAQVRGAMADELTNIENAVIEEDSRLRDLNVALDLEEVAGNQLQASNAQAASEKSMQEGITGAIDVAGQAAAFAPLYAQNISSQRAAAGGMQTQYNTPNPLTKDIRLGQQGGGITNAVTYDALKSPTLNSLPKSPFDVGVGNMNARAAANANLQAPTVNSFNLGTSPATVKGIDYSIFNGMNNAQMRQWKRQNPNLWNKMKTSPEYIAQYNKI